MIILKGKHLDPAVFFAERLRKLVEETEFKFEEKNIPVTISLGVATLDVKRHKDTDEFIKATDAELYKAKEAGRNQVAYTKV